VRLKKSEFRTRFRKKRPQSGPVPTQNVFFAKRNIMFNSRVGQERLTEPKPKPKTGFLGQKLKPKTGGSKTGITENRGPKPVGFRFEK
jgi:hypothetical protein